MTTALCDAHDGDVASHFIKATWLSELRPPSPTSPPPPQNAKASRPASPPAPSNPSPHPSPFARPDNTAPQAQSPLSALRPPQECPTVPEGVSFNEWMEPTRSQSLDVVATGAAVSDPGTWCETTPTGEDPPLATRPRSPFALPVHHARAAAEPDDDAFAFSSVKLARASSCALGRVLNGAASRRRSLDIPRPAGIVRNRRSVDGQRLPLTPTSRGDAAEFAPSPRTGASLDEGQNGGRTSPQVGGTWLATKQDTIKRFQVWIVPSVSTSEAEDDSEDDSIDSGHLSSAVPLFESCASAELAAAVAAVTTDPGSAPPTSPDAVGGASCTFSGAEPDHAAWPLPASSLVGRPASFRESPRVDVSAVNNSFVNRFRQASRGSERRTLFIGQRFRRPTAGAQPSA